MSEKVFQVESKTWMFANIQDVMYLVEDIEVIKVFIISKSSINCENTVLRIL